MSTLVEIAGLVCLSIAAFLVHVIAGLVVTGACLLFVGYALEDAAAAVALRRVTRLFARKG